jgi:hypothetical protein
MIQSETLNELAAALAAAQGEFDAVDKSAANPFFKSAYAPLPEVVKAATPILTKLGLSVSQLIGRDESGDTLTAMLLHKSGQYIGSTMQLRPVKQDPQAQGSAVTYARRYSYMAILGLVAEEDDDGNAGSAPRKAQQRPAQQSRPKPKPEPAQAKPAEVSPDPAKAIGDKPVDDDTLKQISAAAKARWPDRAVMRDQLKWQLIGLEGIEFDANDEDPALLTRVMSSLRVGQALELLKRLEGDSDVPGSGATA